MKEVFGNITLYNADCMEIMRTMPDSTFDLAIVDPPYGIGAGKGRSGPGYIIRESKDWDEKTPNAEYFSELFRVSKNQIVFGANYMTDYLPPSMGWIVWNKGQRNFTLADGELAWTSFKRALRIFDFARGSATNEDMKSGGKIHPTQKPISIYKWILDRYAQPGDTILDTHLGSGSSAIAAHDGGFEFTGIEIDPEYYTGAQQRLIDHQMQQKLF